MSEGLGSVTFSCPRGGGRADTLLPRVMAPYCIPASAVLPTCPEVPFIIPTLQTLTFVHFVVLTRELCPSLQLGGY